MKKLFLLFAIVALFSSCTKSPKDQMLLNLEVILKKQLLVESSYKLSKFDIKDTIYQKDVKNSLSTYVSMKDTLTDFLNKLNNEYIPFYQKRYDNCEYYEVYSRSSDLEEVKQQRDDLLIQLKGNKAAIDSITKIITKYKSEKDIVYYVTHYIYEAKNKGGNLGVYEYSVLFNPDYTPVSDNFLEGGTDNHIIK